MGSNYQFIMHSKIQFKCVHEYNTTRLEDIGQTDIKYLVVSHIKL